MTPTEMARRIDALTSEVREVRRLVTQLVEAQAERDPVAVGVQRLPDGRMFLPGTGTVGDHGLSEDEARILAQHAEARRQLAEMDADSPARRLQRLLRELNAHDSSRHPRGAQALLDHFHRREEIVRQIEETHPSPDGDRHQGHIGGQDLAT